MKEVCDRAREILIEEGNIENVHSPVTVMLNVSVECIDLWRHSWSILRFA